ncbi:MAG: sugar nucleotide-binding protein [Flavobacteriaceae bacterium]|nr:sugar nucleotide-binding protein [Flavobacteriaceae bacterium]
MKKILILGASGFIGNTLFKELSKFYSIFGTFYSNKILSKNSRFIFFDYKDPKMFKIIKKIKPTLIISSLRGSFIDQIKIHEYLINYINNNNSRLMFLSSSNVFDAFQHFPSYEYDKTLSESIYGRFKIKIENMILNLSTSKYVIVRLPMVFGKNSPRNKQIKLLINNNNPIEVFPNTIININTDYKLKQQIHYIINKKLSGIYHLGSYNLISHFELIKLIVKKTSSIKPIYKQIFTSNNLRYLAVLSKKNKLPDHLNNSYESILKEVYF